MIMLLSAFAALLLLLLALKLSHRLTLRLKVLAGVSVSREPQKSCPHLGLAGDPFSHAGAPADEHRCYLWMQRDRIDLVHQKSFCLTSAHHQCPWLMIRRPDAPPPLRQRLPRLLAGLPAAARRIAIDGVRSAPALAARCVHASREGAAAGVRGARALAQGVVWVAAHAFGTLRAGARRAGGALAAAGGLLRKGAPALLRAAGLGAASTRSGVSRALQSTTLALRAARRGAVTDATPRAPIAAAEWRSVVREAAVAPPSQPVTGVPREPVLEGAAASAPAIAAGAVPDVALREDVGPGTERWRELLDELEALITEGVAALDRGQESLAHQIFVTATDQRLPAALPDPGLRDRRAAVLSRAWFWRAKSAETLDEVVTALDNALRCDPANLQVQAHLAWARQRQERQHLLVPIEDTPAASPAPPMPARSAWLDSIGDGVRMAGGLAALVLAALWMTTGVLPALGQFLTQLPAGDELLLRRLLLTLNGAALPGHGHVTLPFVGYDLGPSVPFVLAFLFVFTARGLLDADPWARTMALMLAAVAGWLCAAVVSSPDASRLGLVLCIGIMVAAVIGRFDSPKVPVVGWKGYQADGYI